MTDDPHRSLGYLTRACPTAGSLSMAPRNDLHDAGQLHSLLPRASCRGAPRCIPGLFWLLELRHERVQGLERRRFLNWNSMVTCSTKRAMGNASDDTPPGHAVAAAQPLAGRLGRRPGHHQLARAGTRSGSRFPKTECHPQGSVGGIPAAKIMMIRHIPSTCPPVAFLSAF